MAEDVEKRKSQRMCEQSVHATCRSFEVIQQTPLHQLNQRREAAHLECVLLSVRVSSFNVRRLEGRGYNDLGSDAE